MLSSQYGWTTDYIWTLTSREVYWRTKTINSRLKEEINFELQLNKFKPIFKDEVKIEENPELDRGVKERFEKLKQERAQQWPKN